MKLFQYNSYKWSILVMLYSDELNITLVGKYLSKKLNALGLESFYDATNYAAKPDYHWDDSYQYSRETFKKVWNEYPNIQMIFDIHRGSEKRSNTIVNVKNKTAANSHYNQDLHPSAILVEMGGPENNLDEVYYTATMFAEVVNSVLEIQDKE